MSKMSSRIPVSLALFLTLASGLATGAFAQQSPYFVPGNLVVVVEGCGAYRGTCTAVPNGTGNGAGNSSAGGYGDNQAAPITLFQYSPTGASSVTYVNSLVLPQAGSGANLPISGEYGSSSEGTLQLSGTGQYLTLMGYGINAPTFDAAYYPNPGFTGNPYGAAPSGALAQSGSLTGQSYTPIPRVVTLIDPYGNVNSSTALYNIFNTNNPRSIYTADGITSAYVSGQGSGCDATGGVFYTPLGVINSARTAITGVDAAASSSCPTSLAQDTRDVQIYNNTLYISVDSTEGKSFNRSFIGTLGTPPATSLYVPTASDPYATGPTMLAGFGNTGGTGKETITSSSGNSFNAGLQINLSPVNYFFASPSVLYVTDSGNPKQTSANSPLGDGGLQKWVNSAPNGSGTWSLAYTLYQGLNLVKNPTSTPGNTSGSTGLYGLTGTVSGGTVYLYATNYTISDLDPTYLYGITDTLSTATNPGTSFTLLDTAPLDSNFKGVALAPSLAAGSATITSLPSGLAFTSAGAGCTPGTYTTPVTLIWTPGSGCTLSVVTSQGGPAGTQYAFSQWQDGTTGASDAVTAPATSAVYTASFTTDYQLTTSAGTGGTVSAGGYFAADSNATITATPSAGHYFVNFTGTTTSTSNPLILPMNGPQSITANFAAYTPPAGNLDQAVDASTSSTTILSTDTLFVSGWTADAADGAPLTHVTVYIDGNAVGTPTLGIARSDVSAYFNKPAWLDSGYSFTYPVSSLTAGTHSVTVVSTDSDGLSTTFGPLSITVTAVSRPPVGNLDQAVDSATGTQPVSPSDQVFISGWAADWQSNGPVASVQVFIDGNAVGTATLGIARPDVAAYYNNSAWANSGWAFTYPVGSLASGNHTVTVIATGSEGLSTPLGPVTFTVQ
jgi:hypothetical protein